MNVCKIAAPATGNQDFFPDPVGVFHDSHAASMAPSFDGTHHAGGARPENNCIKLLDHVRPDIAGAGCRQPSTPAYSLTKLAGIFGGEDHATGLRP